MAQVTCPNCGRPAKANLDGTFTCVEGNYVFDFHEPTPEEESAKYQEEVAKQQAAVKAAQDALNEATKQQEAYFSSQQPAQTPKTESPTIQVPNTIINPQS